jgi:thiamine biosynthesis protein ThiI
VIELADAECLPSVLSNLKYVFGIAYFAPCIVVESDIETIKAKAAELAESLGISKKKSFKIDASRSYKKFPLTSQQVNAQIGDVVNEATKWKVDLSNPVLTFYIEVAEKNAFIYTEKIQGLGGLPVGVSGRVICLLSGGIDSPVAAWHMMKRGCAVTFVHFHTYTSKIEEKIDSIVKVLNRYQFSSRVYYVPFFDAQERIIENVTPEMRIVVFRKFMMRFAEELAKKEHASAIVTGDNVAQVASQTLENLRTIYSSMTYPVLAPLVGFDKKEIIEIAQAISTYQFSILPYNDCCSALVAKHPKTKSRLEDMKEIEKLIDVESLVSDSLKRAEIVDY